MPRDRWIARWLKACDLQCNALEGWPPAEARLPMAIGLPERPASTSAARLLGCHHRRRLDATSHGYRVARSPPRGSPGGR